MMLFTLIGNLFKDIIASFKNRVINDSGTFEAENDLDSQLNNIGKDLFDSASLVITPNGVKTSKLYAIKPENGSGDLTVTRTTTATRVDESGAIVDVPANVARIDYSNGSPAILVEPQRTNLVYPSDIATTQVRAVTAKIYTLSFYGTGSVVLSGAYSGTLNGTGANNIVSLTFTPTAGNLTLKVSGSVTNWQLEAGSNATSLIKTVSGSVTRNADVISKSGVSSFIGQTQGSVYVDFIVNKKIDNNIIQIAIDDNNRFAIQDRASSNPRILVLNAQTTGVSFNFNQSFLIGRNKVLLVYTNGLWKCFLNGVLRGQANNQIYNSSFDIINLGAGGSPFIPIAQIDGWINNSTLFPTALTDAQAIQLTTL